MKADEICSSYSAQPVGLTLRLLSDDEEPASTSVLIEGSSDALRLLSELLLAVSEEDKEASFSISPTGAGRIHFSSISELGIYIHKIES